MELLESAFAFLDACGFDAVDLRQDLARQPQQLRAALAEPPVGVGELSQGGKLFGRGDEVAWSPLAAVSQHGAGVKFASGAAAGGFSAAAAKRIDGAGQEGFAAEEGIQRCRELLLQVAELEAEGTEVVGHGVGQG